MTLIHAFFMAFVQGVTEFLPISSSGHLAIIPFLFHFPQEIPILFDILLHMGTLIAVIIFLWKDILAIIKGVFSTQSLLRKKSWNLLLKILVAVIPAGIIGILFHDSITELFTSPRLVGFAYFGTAILLFLTFFIPSGEEEIDTIPWSSCILIGIFQAFALIPGFSRAGFTLVGALLVGMKSEHAFRFSFLISIPAILGAFILESASSQSFNTLFTIPTLLGFLTAVLVGLGALWILRWILRSKKLYWFGFYCLALGLFLIMKF